MPWSSHWVEPAYSQHNSQFNSEQNGVDMDKVNNIIQKCRLHRKSLILKPEFISSLHRNLKPPIHELEDGIEIAYNKAQRELD